MLARGGLDPTVVIGGRAERPRDPTPSSGQGEFLVAEADESDGSFLKLSPTIAVVTNIDPEHLDFYRDLAQIQETFLHFINKVPFYGLAVLCLDQPNVQALILPQVEKRFVTYGLRTQADFPARKSRRVAGMTTGSPSSQGGAPRAALAQGAGLPQRLQRPGGGRRSAWTSRSRSTIIRGRPGRVRRCGSALPGRGEVRGITVVDDYGHHPAEIQATLAAAREVCPTGGSSSFQPHRYTRTRALFKEFLAAFDDADVLLVFDVYSAGEAPIKPGNMDAVSREAREHEHANRRDDELHGTALQKQIDKRSRE